METCLVIELDRCWNDDLLRCIDYVIGRLCLIFNDIRFVMNRLCDLL